MNQQIDTYTDTHEAELLPIPNPTDDGLDLLQRQAEAMGAAHRLATVLCNTAMVPQTFRGKPDDGAAAILYGAELGLKPQQALQQVFVVHGQPAIYARTMVALLKAKGYRFETTEDTPQGVTVTATSPRGESETATWTLERAKQAGYTSNKKYTTDPQAMLYAKAAAEVSRKIAPDVLLGIRYSAEDLELEKPVKATATRMDGDRRRGGQSALDRAKAKPAPVVQADEPTEVAPTLAEIESAADMGTLSELMGRVQVLVADEDYAEYQAAANARHTELQKGE